MKLTPKKLSKLRRGKYQSRKKYKKGKKCLKITFRKRKNRNLRKKTLKLHGGATPLIKTIKKKINKQAKKKLAEAKSKIPQKADLEKMVTKQVKSTVDEAKSKIPQKADFKKMVTEKIVPQKKTDEPPKTPEKKPDAPPKTPEKKTDAPEKKTEEKRREDTTPVIKPEVKKEGIELEKKTDKTATEITASLKATPLIKSPDDKSSIIQSPVCPPQKECPPPIVCEPQKECPPPPDCPPTDQVTIVVTMPKGTAKVVENIQGSTAKQALTDVVGTLDDRTRAAAKKKEEAEKDT